MLNNVQSAVEKKYEDKDRSVEIKDHQRVLGACGEHQETILTGKWN